MHSTKSQWNENVFSSRLNLLRRETQDCQSLTSRVIIIIIIHSIPQLWSSTAVQCENFSKNTDIKWHGAVTTATMVTPPSLSPDRHHDVKLPSVFSVSDQLRSPQLNYMLLLIGGIEPNPGPAPTWTCSVCGGTINPGPAPTWTCSVCSGTINPGPAPTWTCSVCSGTSTVATHQFYALVVKLTSVDEKRRAAGLPQQQQPW